MGKFRVSDDSITGLNPQVVTRLEEFDYDSMFLTVNLGSVFVIIFLVTVGLFSILLGNFMNSFLPACFKNINKKLEKHLIWNFCIRLILETAIETIISTILNLKFGRFSTQLPFGDFVNRMYAYFFAAIYLTSPVTIPAFYCYNYKYLSEESFVAKWGSLYEGLRIDSRAPLAYAVIFLLKRIFFALIMLFTPEYPTFQIFFMM